MSPWKVLGIPEGTTDFREIRRAYAAKVREHPPETDPAGFRRVREAYEALREPLTRVPLDDDAGPPLLAERESRPGHADPGASLRETAPRPPGRACEDEIDRIRVAAALPEGPGRDERLKAAIRALADRMRGERHLVPLWSRAVLEAIDRTGRPGTVISCIRYGDLVLDLLEAQGEVAARVLVRLREVGSYGALVKIARALLESPGEPRHEIGPVVVFLAASVALVEPDVAKGLADRAYRNAPKRDGSPEWLDLDRRLAAGAELRGRPEVREFLAGLADGLPPDPNPDRAVLEAAMRKVARLGDGSILRAMLPPDLVSAADASFRTAPAPRTASSTSPYRLVVVLVVGAILGLTRACPDRATSDPPRTDWREEHRRLMEDYRKTIDGEDWEKFSRDILDKTPEERMRELKKRFPGLYPDSEPPGEDTKPAR